MSDPIQSMQQSAQSGPHNVAAVTPADGADLSNYAYCVWVGTSGDMKVDTLAGQTVTFKAVVAGMWHAIACTKIYDTDTTADEILIGYLT